MENIDRRFLCMSPSPADSDLSFPQEQPTRQDWQVGRSTWYGVTLQSGQLQSPLGEWVNRPLSRWRWIHLPEKNQIANIRNDITHIFECNSSAQTRSGDKFIYTYSTTREVSGMPIPILINTDMVGSQVISNHSHSQNTIPTKLDESELFWKNNLRAGGGEWKWENIHFDELEDTSVEWIVDPIETNKYLWVMDSSHFSQ